MPKARSKLAWPIKSRKRGNEIIEKIYLKVKGDGTAFSPKRAWLVLGDHGVESGDHLLSADCASAEEVKEQADYLKRLLDKAVAQAQRAFSK